MRPVGGALSARVHWVRVGVLVVVYLVFCLQQVVAFQWHDFRVSLGTAAILLVAAAVSIWAFVRHRVPRSLGWPLAGIGVLALVLGASLLASDHARLAFGFTVRLWLALALLWACLNLAVLAPGVIRDATLALLVVLWLGAAAAFGSWLHWPPVVEAMLLFHPSDTYKYWPREAAFYEHPALFGASSVLVALLSAHAWSRGDAGRLRLWLSVAGMAAALALSGSRNPFLPLLAGGLWLALRGHRRQGVGRYILLAMLALVVMGVLTLMVLRQEELLSAREHGLATALTLGRTYLWAGAVDAWLTRPWLGLGPSVFQFFTPDFTGGRFHVGELHAHNLILALLSETGVVGLSAFTFLLYSLARPLRERLRAGIDRTWMVAGLVAFLAFGVFDYYLPFYPFSIHCMLVVAFLYTLPPSAVAEAIDGTSRLTECADGRERGPAL